MKLLSYLRKRNPNSYNAIGVIGFMDEVYLIERGGITHHDGSITACNLAYIVESYASSELFKEDRLK